MSPLFAPNFTQFLCFRQKFPSIDDPVCDVSYVLSISFSPKLGKKKVTPYKISSSEKVNFPPEKLLAMMKISDSLPHGMDAPEDYSS